MNPKFAINEDVILVATENTKFNGKEYVVAERTYASIGTPLVAIRGRCRATRDTYYYKLSPTTGELSWWREDCLRKRPSDFSFDELINNLKIEEPA